MNTNITLQDLPSDILCCIDEYLNREDLIKMRFLVSDTLYSTHYEDWRLLNKNVVNAHINIQKQINKNILKSKIKQNDLNMECNSFRHKSHLIKLYTKYLNKPYNTNIELTVAVLNNILLATITYNDNIKNILKDQRYLIKCGGKLKKIFDYQFFNNQLQSVVIPSCVKVIGNFAFRYNQLEHLYIPKSVKTIGKYAFANNKLTKIKFLKNLQHIDIFAFYSNYLINIVIPKYIKTIGIYAFHKNYLKNIQVSDNVNYVLSEQVVIPDTIKHIGNLAFGCNFSL